MLHRLFCWSPEAHTVCREVRRDCTGRNRLGLVPLVTLNVLCILVRFREVVTESLHHFTCLIIIRAEKVRDLCLAVVVLFVCFFFIFAQTLNSIYDRFW